MKLKWTLPVLLVTLTAAAQMPSAMDQFMHVMETSLTKMDMRATPGSAQPIVRCGWIGHQCKRPCRLYSA
jgi:hypothetical protein